MYDQYFLKSGNLTPPSRILHDERRAMTYPSGITNTWYHFCDSKDLINGKVLEFRALGKEHYSIYIIIYFYCLHYHDPYHYHPHHYHN